VCSVVKGAGWGCVYHETSFMYQYGVATISRLLKIIGLFRRISSLL